MKTIEIKGKDYILVNERLKHFREHYPEYSLTTKIIQLDSAWVVMQAELAAPSGRILATGTAYEKSDSSYINKTSYVENCETSAWGRCLGNFGIGIDTSVASAEEVMNAINNQDKVDDTWEYTLEHAELLKRLIEETKADEEKFFKFIGANSLDNLSKDQFNKAHAALLKKSGKKAA